MGLGLWVRVGVRARVRVRVRVGVGVRELRYTQPLAHGGRRAAVARVRSEVGLLG